ncbi:MAG: discoidin domain-containing protein [Verrucomicrobia bacterium]|nr:discoidin domain-containing protein [Verrucomicrobiota bacterium]
MKTMRMLLIIAAALVEFTLSTAFAADARRVVSLNGQWDVAEGGMDQPPAKFSHRAPVPGLVDMATPPFVCPGSTVSLAERRERKRPVDPKREAFWYRRAFKLKGPLPEVARLKINKARYSTKVILNGKVVGEHGPNWTPGWFDVKPFLKGDGAENELLIRVGASLAQVPAYLTEGWDFEKSRYIPGIYDSVELVLCGTPHIVNVQTVPDVARKTVRAVIELASASNVPVKGIVREAKSGRVVGEAASEARATGKVELTVLIRDARLWTPEDPFLYELVVDTGGDTSRTRFGMRTFTTDPASGRALLNGRPYFLRGSNVCIYRFFEDAARGGLPWNREWVRKLHRRFKEMHWNSLRYCIGFPPEFWYEIADEEGVMIQDEFPIWYGGRPDAWPKEITQQHLAVEFTEWMRERWNHPCVVIWDAQNETTDDAVVAATLMAVRGLDLSNRPWDNGWGTPQKPGDISEAHPYRAGRKGFFANLANETGIPDNGPKKKDAARPPYLINEYGWLWINRDGTLPTLTVDVYKRLLGEKATVAERFHYYARTLAAKTEFWRSRRLCAGVLHFCGLGYSRHDGQTSDHFVDVKNLVYEPNFRRYVSDAFAPTGIMLDFWTEDLPAGEKRDVSTVVINDLYEPWNGSVRLRLLRGSKTLAEQTQPCEVAALGDRRLAFSFATPTEPGRYTLEAALVKKGAPDVRSLRDFSVLTPEEREARRNLAEGRPVKALSVLTRDGQTYRAEFAVDGKADTRWSSEFSDPQWLTVDLGAMQKISRVELQWEGAFAKTYAIQVSPDGENWKTVCTTNKGVGKTEVISFAPTQARWVRIHGTQRGTRFGYSLWEVRVYH